MEEGGGQGEDRKRGGKQGREVEKKGIGVGQRRKIEKQKKGGRKGDREKRRRRE